MKKYKQFLKLIFLNKIIKKIKRYFSFTKMLGIKRKHEDLSDGSDILINMVTALMFQYKEENYETEVMLREIVDLVFTSEYNIFNTKQECMECVQNIYKLV